MVNVLADLPIGEPPKEEWLAPLFDAVNGYPDAGVPFKLIEVEDDTFWALQVRNKDTTNSKHFDVLHSDGVTDRFRVTDAGAAFTGPLAVTGDLAVTGETTMIGNDANFWALQVKNADATNGKSFNVQYADATDAIRVENGGITLSGGVVINGGLDVSAAAGEIDLNDNVNISGSLQVTGNLGFFGAAVASQGSVAGSASDLSSVITLANSLRTLVQRYNLA